ncbi:MAG TPA: aminoacyl-tRNA hydrolase [Clostridiales bacterium]|nr:MAG: Peptidyl-tRNA hydrolase [Firmicutes bacterium ADurb.Bin262]HOU09498.1 aminoacyl-tRNA hydrolase [Clostridiales bacterium]HQK73204.1 aminoacyl-tRNA hydrolase [Clostridiales bacterium]
MFSMRKRASGGPEYIVAGLGNPGKQYETTRHNSGFLFIDALADRHGVKINKIKFRALTAKADIGGRCCLLMKPQTYMNESGLSLREACGFYKIPPEKVVVIFDDVSLPFATVRVRPRGSDGGHNGVASIISHLGSSGFPRVKVGIGPKPHEEMELGDWVLSRFSAEELKALGTLIPNVCGAVELIVVGDINKAMDMYNANGSK